MLLGKPNSCLFVARLTGLERGGGEVVCRRCDVLGEQGGRSIDIVNQALFGEPIQTCLARGICAVTYMT